MRALAASTHYKYEFFGGLEDHDGIRAFKGDDIVSIHPITFNAGRNGKRYDISNFNEAVSPSFDATIVLGNPNMPGAWKAVSQARRNGLKTAYWAHGWLKREPWIKAKARNFFYSRADLVLTYGERAKDIASASGFCSSKIRVIWNSLDWDRQTDLFKSFACTPRDILRNETGMPSNVPVLMTVSRVTDICRYDWLVSAAAILRKRGVPVEIWVVGDGPALQALQLQAKSLGVPLHARGAIYDEEALARQIMGADMIVSPGKVGLTAMHALAYGTPTVTHSDFDRQMPEVEAIVDGVSGRLFRYGDIHDLACVIEAVLNDTSDISQRRNNARSALDGRFTPSDQARLIDDAMGELLDVV